ncbi:MAG: 4-aminobutyrate aminotransferase / (S)-3-amino-2-methylpropionate transaminase / 5-aminovalerate [Baekduia sp.]|nr:4-aminobutyrate aminotransferase / (S)-3-amino-2-methylpropionate transaminase / 5-aminovalerate [Baekduia sp.]
MALQEQSVAEKLIDARERYVARGAGNPKLVVGGANGAVIEGLDGREYLDFVGGIGCQNLGHGPEKVVAAVHAQVDRFMHQMSMVVSYEGYVEVCRRLAEHSPCRGSEQKSILVNSGAEAIENAVKISRAATGRPAVLVFDRAFHGRTLLAMTMTSKLVYKKTFGPFAPEVYRVAAPYEYRGISSDDAIAAIELAFKTEVDPESVACAVLEPVQGEGGFIPMPLDFPARLKELLDRYGILYVDDEIQSGCGRTGTMWAIEHYGVHPDLVASGKTLGGGLPLAAVTGRAEVMDAPHIGGLGGTFAGNPVSCAAATVVLEELARPEVLAAATRLGERLRAGLDDLQSRITEIGDVRGLGPMLAIELVTDRKTKEPAAELVTRTIAEALDRGLLLMGSGVFSNVIRFLPPLNIEDAQLERGLSLVEESLVAAGATR